MKVVVLTGSHRRHAHILRTINEIGFLVGSVIEDRGEIEPKPPANLDARLQALWKRHFSKRAATEERFFPESLDLERSLNVSMVTLNDSRTSDFINSLSPDIVLTYGVHKLTAETLSGLDAPVKWNIHGGLSPWYRGTITHFWPSYFFEPQKTGLTLHELSQEIDGGALIHQTVSPLVRGDGIHDLSCRAVEVFARDLREVLRLIDRGSQVPSRPQSSSGRLFKDSDWHPSHLRVVYELLNDQAVDLYLDGELTQGRPETYRQIP